jgi:hydrogenase-4 membrane subunit HyfE
MQKIKYYNAILLFFAIFSALLVVFAKKLDANGFTSEVVIWGNIILFVVTLFSTFFLVNGLKASSTHHFIRSVYGSLMVKLFVCIIAIFVYVKVSATINKPSIFLLMGLYFVYAFLEIKSLNQLTRDLKKDAQGKKTI